MIKQGLGFWQRRILGVFDVPAFFKTGINARIRPDQVISYMGCKKEDE